jgi:hypothetical protein
MKEDKYIVQLDGLRFIAVIMVMIAHWAQWQWSNPILTSFPFVHGVTLFFVLSGFLITRILLTKKEELITSDSSIGYLLKNFYLRRFLRIFPIYYLLIAFLFTIDYKNTRDFFLWLVTYSSNIYQSIRNEYVGDFNHFWSLAVEEQFYLIWPLILLFIKPNKILLTIIITIVFAILLKTYFYLYIGKWMATSYFTLNCMHAIGIGSLFSYFTLYNKKIIDIIEKPIWLYFILFLYFIFLILEYKFRFGWYKEVGDELLFALLSALIILRASKNGFKLGIKYFLENKFVIYAGKISYGIYVYHLFMPTFYYFISPRLGISITNKYTMFIAFFFLTFFVSHLSWLIIEKPILSIKSKLPYIK